MASQAKDRHSAQLARSLTEFNQTIAQTKSLLEDFSTDLSAMRTLTAIHVSQFMTVATDMDAGAWRNDSGSNQGK